jgi:hypothetical protein
MDQYEQSEWEDAKTKGDVGFVREAFGARTICTLQAWTLVVAFAKMASPHFMKLKRFFELKFQLN